MSPKKKGVAKVKRSLKGLGKKPSPKKMSPMKSPVLTSRDKETLSSRVSRSFSGSSPQDPSDKSQHVTPHFERSATQTPRSNERYNLREDVTPLSFSYFPKTPLRTPSGKLIRPPLQSCGRTISTPFRTPRLKSLGKEPQPDPTEAFKLHKKEAVTWKQHLKLITSKTYKICNLSTMSNFRYKNKKLRKKYENHLKNKVLDVYPSPSIVVSLDTTSCLTLRPGVVDAVTIEIRSLYMKEDVEEDEMVTVYNAWLFRTLKKQCRSVIEMEWFPVMLYNGKELIHHAVTDWLQGSFGCYISKYGIRQADLMWIAGAWSGRPCSLLAHQEKKYNKVDLTYNIHPPHGMDHFPIPNARGKARFKFCVTLEDIHHIWKSIVDTSREEMTEEEMFEFFATINKLAEKMSLLPSFLLSFHQLKTPCINLTSDGMVNVSCRQSVRVIVNHLIDIFLQTSCFSTEEESLMDLSSANEGENSRGFSGTTTSADKKT